MKRKTGNRFVVLFYRIWYSIIAIIRSDKIILNNVGRPSVPNRVNLHWWDSSIEINGDVPSNLGDNLSEVVVGYMLKRKGLSLDKEYVTKYGESMVLSMVTDDYEGWIGKMVRAKKVISSSLHGIILAESFGMPAIWLRDREALKDFKYEDYYGSTNRDKFFYANTVEEAIEMTPMELPKNIKELQQGLLNSFPYDLWNN